MIGHLTSVAVAGLRTPHGDVFEMLYVAEPTLAALEGAEKHTSELTGEMSQMQVHKERTLAIITLEKAFSQEAMVNPGEGTFDLSGIFGLRYMSFSYSVSP